jgi:2-oxoglutarate dehydrogenase E1 component
VLGEIDPLDPKKVERLMLCSGKVYYDLLEKPAGERGSSTRSLTMNVAIVRLEQLYPFPEAELAPTKVHRRP